MAEKEAPTSVSISLETLEVKVAVSVTGPEAIKEAERLLDKLLDEVLDADEDSD